MSAQPNAQQSGGGCLLTALIMISICLALLVGAAGGVMLDGQQLQRQAPNFPDIPAPATLNYVPSAQTFPDTGTCADPTAPVAGWEKGVGGELPPCWASWTREQQNAFLRSH